MMYFIALLVLLCLLYFITARVKQYIYLLVYRATKHKTTAMAGITALLYPGTVIHELSHLIVALILFVPVKHLELYPQIEDGQIRAGSVTTTQCDIVRRTLIGIAPLFVGITTLYLLTTMLLPGTQDHSFFQNISNFKFQISNLGILYLIFSVSASMFSSKKDLESFTIVGPLLLLVVTLLYFTGFQFEVLGLYIENMSWLFQNVSLVLCLPVAIHSILFVLLSFIKPNG